MLPSGGNAGAARFAQVSGEPVDQFGGCGLFLLRGGVHYAFLLKGQFKEFPAAGCPGRKGFCLQADLEHVFRQFGLIQRKPDNLHECGLALPGCREAHRHGDPGRRFVRGEAPQEAGGPELTADEPVFEFGQQALHREEQGALVGDRVEQVQAAREHGLRLEAAPRVGRRAGQALQVVGKAGAETLPEFRLRQLQERPEGTDAHVRKAFHLGFGKPGVKERHIGQAGYAGARQGQGGGGRFRRAEHRRMAEIAAEGLHPGLPGVHGPEEPEAAACLEQQGGCGLSVSRRFETHPGGEAVTHPGQELQAFEFPARVAPVMNETRTDTVRRCQSALQADAGLQGGPVAEQYPVGVDEHRRRLGALAGLAHFQGEHRQVHGQPEH